MNTFETITSRRSCRNFKDTPVRKEEIDKIVEAGRYAPSGGNSQKTHFFVISDPAFLDQLTMAVQKAFAKMEDSEDLYRSIRNSIRLSKKGSYDFRYHAPVLIATANDKDYPNHMADCVCAIENMMLMANDLDLGSCYINQLNWLNEDPDILALFRKNGLKDEERIYGSVAIGYANTEDSLPVRTPLPRTGYEVTYI